MKSQKKTTKPIEITDIIENRSFELLRFFGYTLIILSIFDYAAILIPPRLTNPNWEFQAISQMVDHVWSVLLGLVFVFLFNETSVIKGRQIALLKLLSWLSDKGFSGTLLKIFQISVNHINLLES